MFDLPVVEANDRKKASRFRKFLEKNGFSMCQFSVYTRFCGTREKTTRIYKAIEEKIPAKGKVNIIQFTDKQFGKIVHIENRKKRPKKENPEQLILFSDQ